LPAPGPARPSIPAPLTLLLVRRMWSAVHGAGAEAKTLDMDVERTSQAATPEVCHRSESSPRRTKARSKTFDLGTVYVCVYNVAECYVLCPAASARVRMPSLTHRPRVLPLPLPFFPLLLVVHKNGGARVLRLMQNGNCDHER
jgi:hypothetical protein